MLNFYYGDIIESEVSNLGWEIIKALLATIPAVIGVWLGVLSQRWVDKTKNREIQNLQLLNFNEHIEKIIKDSEQLTIIFTEFAESVEKNPLDEVLITRRLYIPDLTRVLEIDKEKIFFAFVQNYKEKDKKQAAQDYKKAYNALDTINHTTIFLYDRYDRISSDIFQLKLQVKNGLMEVRGNASRLGRAIKSAMPNHYKEDELYKSLDSVLSSYFEKMGNEKKPLNFHEVELFKALRDKLLPFSTNESVYELLSITRNYINLIADIRGEMNNLGRLLKTNSKNISDSRVKLAEVSSSLNPLIKSLK